MIDNLVRDLQVLWKADALIGKIWLNVMARRFGLFAFAGLIAVFGLGMANVAGFYALQPSWSPCGWHCCNGPLRRADNLVPTALWFADHRPRPAADPVVWGDRAPKQIWLLAVEESVILNSAAGIECS
jgi:hypothetical protein